MTAILVLVIVCLAVALWTCDTMRIKYRYAPAIALVPALATVALYWFFKSSRNIFLVTLTELVVALIVIIVVTSGFILWAKGRGGRS